MGDETAKTDEVTTLAIQIGFEVLEKGYRLVMTDRVGVDAEKVTHLTPRAKAQG